MVGKNLILLVIIIKINGLNFLVKIIIILDFYYLVIYLKYKYIKG